MFRLDLDCTLVALYAIFPGRKPLQATIVLNVTSLFGTFFHMVTFFAYWEVTSPCGILVNTPES